MPYSNPSDPVISANKLASALRENTEALNSVRNRYRIVAACVLFTFAVLAASIWTRYEAKIEFCHDDNTLRAGLLHVADQIEAGVPRPISEENQRFIDGLRHDFALQDCSNITVLG